MGILKYTFVISKENNFYIFPKEFHEGQSLSGLYSLCLKGIGGECIFMFFFLESSLASFNVEAFVELTVGLMGGNLSYVFLSCL